jgi:CRP-like cAMP-binding protein
MALLRGAPAREPRGEGPLVLCEGEVERRVRFVVRGVFRLFRALEEREVVLGFDGPGRLLSAYDSLVAGRPSRFSIQALTVAELVSFDGALLQTLYARHPLWERIGRRLAEEHYANKVRKEDEGRTLEPLERYERLLGRASPWIHEVPQYQIASFLGVAPETWSRMRNRS